MQQMTDKGTILLAHGAGANCDSPLLVAIANAFTAAGYDVLRFDLPFRLKRRNGPPHPSQAVEDRQGIKARLLDARQRTAAPVYAGGHSYGGRQTSMLLADEPGLCDGLLLLSYPLHPPNRPADLRTAHFPKLRTRTLFVHGSKDPFGSEAEMHAALELIVALRRLSLVPAAGHDLRRGRFDIAEAVVKPFQDLIAL